MPVPLSSEYGTLQIEARNASHLSARWRKVSVLAFERAHAGGDASALRGDLPEGRSLCGALSPADALSFEYADDLKHWYTPPEGFVASNLEGRATTFARDKALKSLA